MIEITKYTKEDLEKQMEAKIKAIPVPQMETEQFKPILERNRELDRQNMEHTLKILQKRQIEAISVDDRKKKYAAIALACDQQDQYNLRNRILDLEKKFHLIRKTIPDEEWEFLEPLYETVRDDETFWTRCSKDGCTSEQEIHRVFKEEFDIQPKYIVKLIELIKIQQDITKFESMEQFQMGTIEK